MIKQGMVFIRRCFLVEFAAPLLKLTVFTLLVCELLLDSLQLSLGQHFVSLGRNGTVLKPFEIQRLVYLLQRFVYIARSVLIGDLHHLRG
jgi:hypothetical protein